MKLSRRALLAAEHFACFASQCPRGGEGHAEFDFSTYPPSLALWSMSVRRR